MMGLDAVMVRHRGVQRLAAVGEMEGGGMPRRWQTKNVNSASVRRAPLGMRWQRRREDAPRTAHARTRAMAWGAAWLARRRSRRWREVAWAKTDWEWRFGRRRMLAMDGALVEGSKRREWTVAKSSVS